MRSETPRFPEQGDRRHSARKLLTGAGVLCAGLLYGCVLVPLGLCIPCPFRSLTGWRCPGCGITAICLDLLHGRFSPSHNWGLALLAPWLALLAWAERRGRRSRLTRALAWALVGALLAWGVLRNLWGI